MHCHVYPYWRGRGELCSHSDKIGTCIFVSLVSLHFRCLHTHCILMLLLHYYYKANYFQYLSALSVKIKFHNLAVPPRLNLYIRHHQFIHPLWVIVSFRHWVWKCFRGNNQHNREGLLHPFYYSGPKACRRYFCQRWYIAEALMLIGRMYVENIDQKLSEIVTAIS